MPLTKGKLEKLRQAVKLHVNWFVAAILGEDALTAQERAELEKFKKLPKQALSLIERGFVLGRLKSIFKKKEWKGLSWEDFIDLAKRQSLSPLEKLVLQQAKLSAAQHIKGLADDIAAGVFNQLAKTTNQVVSEASLKQIISDEVQLAVLEKKSYTQLASSLAAKTKTQYGYKWEQISRTELHSAKTHGLAQAIINKVDVYKHSKGIDSMVSLVPKPGTCPDCARHYLDKSGNPRVFSLRQLMGAGSNADPGVVHKKTKGVHLQWKTTLPPLHPNCRCELVFIPPGYTWVNAQLTLTNPSVLKKAIGDSKLSGTVKPQGPASAKASGPVNPPTIPGIKSPGQADNGGRPAAPKSAWAGMEVDYIPKAGTAEKPEGAVGDTESSWVVPKGFRPGKALTPEQEAQKKQLEKQAAIEYGKADNPHAEILSHLSKGEFTDMRQLSGDEAGLSGMATYLVQFKDGPRGLLKATTKKLYANSGDPELLQIGEGTTIPGTGPQREAAAYNMHMQFGLKDHVPPTTTRIHNGANHSIQSWAEGFGPARSMLSSAEKEESGVVVAGEGAKKSTATNEVKSLLERCPADKKEALKQKLFEGATMNIVCNNGDGHNGNILVKEDFSDVRFIDNSASFGHGMVGVSSEIHGDMHNAGMKLKVPDHLMEKFSKTSYGDIQKATKGLDDRESAQTFLRMRYVQHLMDTEGHLDFEKFRPEVMGPGGGGPRIGMWNGSGFEQVLDYAKRREKGELAHDQFVAFAKDFISSAQDENHPDNKSVSAMFAKQSPQDVLISGEEFYDKHVVPNSEAGEHPSVAAERKKMERAHTLQDAPGSSAPSGKKSEFEPKRTQVSTKEWMAASKPVSTKAQSPKAHKTSAEPIGTKAAKPSRIKKSLSLYIDDPGRPWS